MLTACLTFCDSFFRQLDYIVATVANEDFRALYALEDAARYAALKDAVFARHRTAAELVGALLVRAARRRRLNVMIETSGRDAAMFRYVDALFPAAAGYRRLAVNFAINDIAFAERSVDARMRQVAHVLAQLSFSLSYTLLSTSQADADTFTGLQALSSTLSGLKAKIAALPADQQTGFLNGNVNDIAAKYGQSTDPKLRTIGQEFAHLGVYYGKAIGGVRGAVSAAGSNGTVFQSLVPNIKEGKNLILSDIDGFNNTAADLVDNTVAAKIGQDTFSQIYGDSVFPKAAAPAAAAPVTMYLNGKSYPIDPSKVDIAKQNGMTLTQ